MVDKLRKGKESEKKEPEPNYPARRRKLGENTREKVKDVAGMGKFEKSEIGQEILALLGSVSEILESEDSLNMVLGMLANVSDDAGRKAALVFLKVASKKFPKLVQDCLLDPDFDSELRERLIKEMGWKANELPVKAVEFANSGRTAEEIKSTEESNKGAENPESLVSELEKTEVFMEVLEMAEREDMIDDLKKRYQSIDWDRVAVDMTDYSVRGIEAYARKNKLTLHRQPKANSAEELIADPRRLDNALLELGADNNHVNPRHYGAFVLLAAEKNPKLVFDFFSTKPYAEIKDPDFKKAVVALLVKKGFPAKLSNFEPPTEEVVPESLTPILPEEVVSEVRKSLVERGQVKNLPQELMDLMGKNKSWKAAMEKDEVFESFLMASEKLEKKLDPELFSEMLVIAAEQSNEIDDFFKTYDATSWRQAMGSPVLFHKFMAEWWFGQQIYPNMEPRLVLELLMVAVKESKENAKWVLDKAKRDEKGDMCEEPAYELKKALGQKAFQTLLAAAKQKTGVK